MIRQAALTLFFLSTTASVLPASGNELDKSLDQADKDCRAEKPGACWRVAEAYVFGNAVARQPKKAVELLERICLGPRRDKCELPLAALTCRRLGQIYERGEAGIEKDPRRAAAFYWEAFDSGDAVAGAALSGLSETGQGGQGEYSPASFATLACRQKNFLSTSCGATEAQVSEYLKTVTQICERKDVAESPRAATRPLSAGAHVAGCADCRVAPPLRVTSNGHDGLPPMAGGRLLVGKVVLEINVKPDGSVADVVSLRETHPRLVKPVVATARQWRFAPTLVDGKAVSVVTTMPMTFNIDADMTAPAPPAETGRAADTSDAAQKLDRLHEGCAQKDAAACSALTDLYIFGDGVALRPEKARQFLSGICALDRHAPEPCLGVAVGLACRRIAGMYANGEGLKKDLLIAAGYYRIGSERGDAVSSAALSRMFGEGTGIPQDAARARGRLLKACGQKDFLSPRCGITAVRVSEYERAVTEACAVTGPTPTEGANASSETADIFLTPGQALPSGRTIREPRKLFDVPPRYPPEARKHRVQGQVVLETYIGVDGRVVDMKVKSGGPAELTDPAIAAVARWRYEPALVDDLPHPVIMTVTVTFRLSR